MFSFYLKARAQFRRELTLCTHTYLKILHSKFESVSLIFSENSLNLRLSLIQI